MRSYRDFDIEITEPERDAAGAESLRVRVAASPAGEQRRDQAVRVNLSADLRPACGRLDRRELDLNGLLALGRALGDVLLPDAARRLYEQSLATLDDPQGLRIRLKLDTWGIADLPWEFSWLPPGGSESDPADASGFLLLNPRISIVRYELLSEPIAKLEPVPGRNFRLVAVFSAPKDPNWVPLDLAGEERGLRSALEKRREIELTVVEAATLAGLESTLLEGAEVFHFAGHGRFQAGIEDQIGIVAGKGFLLFCDSDGKAAEVSAEKIVVNLHGRGVRLAVLGACEGARRDRFNPWTGIAPALVRGGLPAVVAMQATLYDRSAVAFSTQFYESLALGQPVDAAVSAGRIAIFNESGPGERDWGVPVLYLRAESGILFPKAASAGDGEVAEEPLGWRGWVNAAVAAAVLVALIAAFYAYAHPRFASRWLWGSGVSLVTVGSLLLAWFKWVAGDEARAMVRHSLLRPRTSGVLALAVVVASALAVFLFSTVPIVLRVVPGTRLLSHLHGDGPEYSLLIWQGEGGGEPDWVLRPFGQSGAALGSSGRVSRLALSRSRSQIETGLQAYLARRRVPEEQRERWVELWQRDVPLAVEEGASVRRRATPLRIELRQGEQVVATQPIEVQRVEEAEDHVDLVFIEPAGKL